jgi:hypothetical protein
LRMTTYGDDMAGGANDQGLVRIMQREIWTPEGPYRSPAFIAAEKSSVCQALPDVMAEARSRDSEQRLLTSGEWHQIRVYSHEQSPHLEESMITGCYEMTSTLLDFEHDLIIQLPVLDNAGELVIDKKGIIQGRHIWKMALPRIAGYVNHMPDHFDTFFNTIYGMEDSMRRLPMYTYLDIEENPRGIRTLLRGNLPDRRAKGFGVHGNWGPLDSGWGVASRSAAESVYGGK